MGWSEFKKPVGFLLRYIEDKRGSVLPFVALTLPVMLGMVGLGTDASLWMAQKRSLQTAADAAALAAAWEIAQESEAYMDNAAFKEAQNNGYDPNANGELLLEILSQEENDAVVAVTLTQDADTFFSKVLFSDPVRILAYAEAQITDMTGDFCVLALEEVASDSLGVFGSVTVDSPNCGIAVNSNDDEAMTMSGNVSINVDSIRITGDYDVTGSVDLTYNTLVTGASPLQDPYDDLEVPEFSGCDQTNVHTTTSATFSPGVYCGGISISGTTDVTFEPGVYIVDGGDFDISGSGTIYGDDVTFILTGSGNDYAQLDISGSRDINLSAPGSGEGGQWSGITFFQDRNAPINDNLQNKIVGTSDIIVNGVVYFPSQGLWFGGNSGFMGGTEPCTLLIARTVTLAGNPAISNNCDGYDIEDLGTPSVKLIR